MPYTQLSPSGVPGKRYSFSAKVPHTGLFTYLSPSGVPGQRYSFSAKQAAEEAEHTGLFTWLSPVALPGGRYSFVAKAEARRGAIWDDGWKPEHPLKRKLYDVPRIDIDRQNEFILIFVKSVTLSGILDD